MRCKKIILVSLRFCLSARGESVDAQELKRKLKTTKEMLAKKVQEKNVYIKELREAQEKMVSMEQRYEAAIHKKQTQLVSLESRSKVSYFQK